MHLILILWVWLCAFCNCAAWLLSATHQLNAAGYLALLLPFILAMALWVKANPSRVGIRKVLRRARKPQAGIFFAIAALLFLGGVVHAPNNYDALTYRFPRIMQWLAHDQWFWITTPDQRLNYSNTGWEWLAAPVFCLAHSDRLLFLINICGYWMMPGLVFSIFRGVGVSRRAAWWWMWIVPVAYGYASQAASVGNDLTGTIFLLCAIYFGLKARKSGRVLDVWCCLLATALVTSVKMSNLPLGLPCLLAVLPALPILRKQIAASIVVLCIGVFASALPIMVLNQTHAGSWTGDPDNKYQMQVKNPAAAFLGNSLLLTEQSFMPPALLHSKELRDKFIATIPAGIQNIVRRDFPRYFAGGLTELPGEEGAGLGLGVTLALIISLCFCVIRAFLGKPFLPRSSKFFLHPILWGALISALVFMLKMGSEAAPRLMLSYYPLMIAIVLSLTVQEILVRSRLWRAFLLTVPLFALPMILLSPSRPILPPQMLCDALDRFLPGNQLVPRMRSVYSAYANRNDLLADLRPSIPESVRDIGVIIGSNDTDYSLWRPIGTRLLEYPNAEPEKFLKNHGNLEWIVIKERAWKEMTSTPLKEWVRQQGGEIVLDYSVVEVVAWGPEDWFVVRFKKGRDAT